MRYRCPSTSAESLVVLPDYDTTVKGKRKHPAKPPRLRGNKIHAAKRAAKRKILKPKNSHHPQNYRDPLFLPPRHVYVGKLLPHITQYQLLSHFSKCGIITDVSIRMSGGQVVTTGVHIPPEARGERDRRYAVIKFANHAGARQALKLDGTTVDGCELVVCVSVLELPEFEDLLHDKMKEIEQRHSPDSEPIVGRSALAHDTEEDLDIPRPQADRHRLFGFSFCKSVI